MFEEIRNRKANLGYVWMKATDTGNTYLCPASKTAGMTSATESQLREFGVDESSNPQND